jgi:hypothetical protein
MKNVDTLADQEVFIVIVKQIVYVCLIVDTLIVQVDRANIVLTILAIPMTVKHD